MEEDIKDLEKYISFASKEENFSHNEDWKWHKDLATEIQNLIVRYKELERQVKIKNAYLTLINDIAYDYDGCNTVKSLKELIDELVKMTKQAYKNDDWTVMYTDLSQTINKNILQELLEESKEKTNE